MSTIEVDASLLNTCSGLLVDIRFHEERDLYGAVENAVILPMPQLLHVVGRPQEVTPEHKDLMDITLTETNIGSSVAPFVQAVAMSKPVYLICAHGNRSLSAARILREIGITAFSIIGGVGGSPLRMKQLTQLV